MASPRRKTTAWSAMVLGLVRKKKPRVMWKRQREVRMVREDMSAIFAVIVVVLGFRRLRSGGLRYIMCFNGCYYGDRTAFVDDVFCRESSVATKAYAFDG